MVGEDVRRVLSQHKGRVAEVHRRNKGVWHSEKGLKSLHILPSQVEGPRQADTSFRMTFCDWA